MSNGGGHGAHGHGHCGAADTVDVREHGLPRDGQPQVMDRRVFMQLLVFDVPATHEFDVGKFNENTMAFPPGVTIKDFQSDVSQGYPNPKPGGQPARFPTIIQIVPVVAR